MITDYMNATPSGHPVSSELTLTPVRKIFSRGDEEEDEDDDVLSTWCISYTDKKGGSLISIISLIFNTSNNSALHYFIRINLYCSGFLHNRLGLLTKGLPLVITNYSLIR